jgi:phospholipid/cholesterol/gamma-HCH transport system substrate-binding protein
MLNQRAVEAMVGLFLIFSMIMLSVLAFKVSGLTSLFPADTYSVTANFDDIGGLKVRSPVKIGGVQVGEVSAINLDNQNFKAVVKMKIYRQFNDIPDDSAAGIFTAGLLGDNYISITPMYNTTYLKDGSVVSETNSAMILEKLIGHLIYKISGDKKEESTTTTNGSDKK